MQLEAGDIVLVRSPGPFGWLIRRFTQLSGERRTKVNHVGVMVDGQNIVEAQSRTRKWDLRWRYAGRSNHIAIYRWKGLAAQEQATVAAKAEEYVGRKYGWFKILAHALDRYFNGIFLFRRLALQDKYPICSWVVAYAYKKIGRDFGVPPNGADPDHIWDYCVEEATASQFECLFPLGTLTQETPPSPASGG